MISEVSVVGRFSETGLVFFYGKQQIVLVNVTRLHWRRSGVDTGFQKRGGGGGGGVQVTINY